MVVTPRAVIRIDMDGNEVRFPSVNAAAKSVCGSRSNISFACKGKAHSAYGYHWRYEMEDGRCD